VPLVYAHCAQEETSIGVQGIWDQVRRTPQDAAQQQALPAGIMQTGTVYHVSSRVTKKKIHLVHEVKRCTITVLAVDYSISRETVQNDFSLPLLFLQLTVGEELKPRIRKY